MLLLVCIKERVCCSRFIMSPYWVYLPIHHVPDYWYETAGGQVGHNFNIGCVGPPLIAPSIPCIHSCKSSRFVPSFIPMRLVKFPRQRWLLQLQPACICSCCHTVIHRSIRITQFFTDIYSIAVAIDIDIFDQNFYFYFKL